MRTRTLYLWSQGECHIISRRDDGSLDVSYGDDLPDSFFEDAEDGVAVFDGTVHDTLGKSEDELEAMGVPSSATNYDGWWEGSMRAATDAEILAVFSDAASPRRDATDPNSEVR